MNGDKVFAMLCELYPEFNFAAPTKGLPVGGSLDLRITATGANRINRAKSGQPLTLPIHLTRVVTRHDELDLMVDKVKIQVIAAGKDGVSFERWLNSKKILHVVAAAA